VVRTDKGGVELDSLELARHIVDTIADIKGESVLLLDIREVTLIADYFVIASTSSNRQRRAIMSEVTRSTKQDLDTPPLHVEGNVDSDWTLMDYGGVVVHIFSHEAREYYDLEGLWHEGKVLVNIL
jgi:ribosome-associated protein